MIGFGKKRRFDPEIAPDEIFLDASNAPDFDRARFEGRLEKPLPRRTFIVLGSTLGLLFIVLAGRAWYLQIANGETYATQSANNSLAAATLFAPRGIIIDLHGAVLAENVEGKDGTIARHYTIPALSHVLGYVSYPKKDTKGIYYDTEVTGVAGLEAEYDAHLAGTNGQVLTETDALGTVRSEGMIIPPVEGKTLQLSIDAELESAFGTALEEVVDSKGFIAGGGVIMDIQTGAVRAIASYPSYDSNVMSSGGPADTIASYHQDPGHPFLDHATQGAYTPGSIVKPFVSAGALTDGIITPSTVINDKGSLYVPNPYSPGEGYTFKGWKALGPVNVEKAIAWSSDVFFYTVGGGFGGQKGLGIDRLDYWYHQFGIGDTTGLGLAGEVSGVIPTPVWKEATFGEPWYLGDTYFTAIGQYGMQVTPIQMARATAALANGGKLCTPTLLVDAAPSCTTVPVDRSALAVVRAGMRDAVTSALASAINLPYVKAAAKTGTAQTGTRNQYDNSWVVGFFPYDDPQYSFAVVLERGPEGTGEQAVNVMRDFFEILHATGSTYVGGLPAQAGSGPATSTALAQ